MTDPNAPVEATPDQPPVYVPPPADTTNGSDSATTSDVSRETDNDAVARAQAALDAALAKRDADKAAAAPVASPVDSTVPEAPVVGVTPVGVAPVVIGPSGLAVPAPLVTVENLVTDVVRLKDEAKSAISTLIKFSRMPEESMMRAVETALHALIEKVL